MPNRPSRGQSYGRASLGLGKYLGGFGGVEDGSFDELPSVDIQTPQGPTQTGAPMRPQVKFNPGRYTPSKPTGWDPFGEKASQANAYNMQAGLTMQQIAAKQALQQANMEAEMYRTDAGNANNLEVEGLRGKNNLQETNIKGAQAIEQQNNIARNAMSAHFGVPIEDYQQLRGQIATPNIVTAGTEAENRLKFATEPAGVQSQRMNYNANLRAPAAENYAKMRTPLQANEDVLLPGGLSGMANEAMLLGGPRSTQTVEPTTKFIKDPKTGLDIEMSGEPKVTTKFGAGPPARTMLDPEEKRRREVQYLKEAQDAEAKANAANMQQQAQPRGASGGWAPQVQARPTPNLGAGQQQQNQLMQLLRALFESQSGNQVPIN